MYESVRGRARRVLVIGAYNEMPFDEMLATGGVLIVMEHDAVRAADMRRTFLNTRLDKTATVISGDPRRMLYKLAGPFDVIVCGPAYLELRPMLERLLAADGVLITNVEHQS